MIHLPITDTPSEFPEIQSAFATVDPGCHCQVGSYYDGLLCILSNEQGSRLLRQWTWLGIDATALAHTAFGDVLFWQPNHGVYFLETQRNHVEFIDTELSWVITDFLKQPQILEQVLRQSYLNRLVAVHRRLNFGEVFILQPWAMLGGVDQQQNYMIGDCGMYLDLVADEFGPAKNRRSE